MVEKTEHYIKSTNGKNQLHTIIWNPMVQVRAILQISHGMAEYIDRYDRLATFLAKQGILVIGNDHLGHGQTAKDSDELGYFPTKEKSKRVVEDLHRVSTFIRRHYPNVPFFLLGHSMGSFMARRYLMTYGDELDGIIIVGTGSQPPVILKAAKMLSSAMAGLKGEHYRSKLLLNLAFGSYNTRIKPKRTDYDWLSRDRSNVDNYLADDYCGFSFTVNGYQVLFDVISFIQDKKNIQKIPKDVPILFLSGTDDPVGHYGKDVRDIAKTYKMAGVKNVKMKLYMNNRHEILNDFDHEEVEKDIWKFICIYGGLK